LLRGLAGVLCVVLAAVALAVALAAVLACPGVVGHVPARALQLEARARDQAPDLAPAGRAPVESRVGDTLRLLEVPALLAPVLVDRHARVLITRIRPVNPAGAARAGPEWWSDRGPAPGPACRVPGCPRGAPGRTGRRRGRRPRGPGPPDSRRP